MAIYSNSPAFKKTYDLLLYMYELGGKLDGLYRYTVVERINNELVDFLTKINKGYNKDNNGIPFDDYSDKIRTINLYLQVLRDAGQLSSNKYNYISEQLKDISEQLGLFQASCCR